MTGRSSDKSFLTFCIQRYTHYFFPIFLSLGLFETQELAILLQRISTDSVHIVKSIMTFQVHIMTTSSERVMAKLLSREIIQKMFCTTFQISQEMITIIFLFVRVHLLTIRSFTLFIWNEATSLYDMGVGNTPFQLYKSYALLAFIIIMCLLLRDHSNAHKLHRLEHQLRRRLERVQHIAPFSQFTPPLKKISASLPRQTLVQQLVSLQKQLARYRTELRWLRLLPLYKIQTYVNRSYAAQGLLETVQLPRRQGQSLYDALTEATGHPPRDGWIVFHGTELDARRSLLQMGIDIQKTEIMYYGKGFYVTPHLETALSYAKERFERRRMTGKRDRSFAPVIMVYWIAPQHLQSIVYPRDVGGNLGLAPSTTILAIRKTAVQYLQPVESLIVENLIVQ